MLSPWLKDKLTHAQTRFIILFTIVSALLSFTFLFNPEKPEFYQNHLSSLITYPAAFGGAMMMCGIAILVARLTDRFSRFFKQIIIFFGKNSYVVLAFHQIILKFLGASGLMLNGIMHRICMWLILYALIYLINTYAPYLLGRNKAN